MTEQEKKNKAQFAKVKAKREARAAVSSPRSMSIPVVAFDLEQYKRVSQLITAFRSVLRKLAALDYLALMASAGWAGEKLLPNRAAKKDLLRAVGGSQKGKAFHYELRTLFYLYWSEMQKVVAERNVSREVEEWAAAKREVKEKGISLEAAFAKRKTVKVELPHADSAVWNSTFPRLKAVLDTETFKRLNDGRPSYFESFGLSFFHVESVKRASIDYVDDENIRVKLRFGNQEFEVIAAGAWTKGGETIPKTLHASNISMLRRFSKGELEWSYVSLRLKGKRLFLDVSYHTPKKVAREKSGYTLQVTPVPQEMSIRTNLKDPDKYQERDVKMAVTVRVVKTDGEVPVDSARFWWKGIRCENELRYLKIMDRRAERVDMLVDAAKSNRDARAEGLARANRNWCTVNRRRFLKKQNHVWSMEIINQALRFGVDSVTWFQPGVPKVRKTSEGDKTTWTSVSPLLFGNSWQWNELSQMLKYKAEEEGFSFEERFFELGKLPTAAGIAAG